jgi:hypothetical protein
MTHWFLIWFEKPGGRLPEIQLKLIHLESNSETQLAISELTVKEAISQLANQRYYQIPSNRSKVPSLIGTTGNGCWFKSSGWARLASSRPG